MTATVTETTQQPLPTNGGAQPTPVTPAAAPPPQTSAAIVPMSDAAPGDEPSRALSAFANEASFKAAYRMAKAMSCSSLVPTAYQGEANIPNVLIAMEMANRIGASVLMVMQNLNVIHGRTSWAATFLIATINASGRFTPLRFRFQGKEGTDDWGCRAVAKDVRSGEECLGSLITINMAKTEGWHAKNGSKWKTMPEQMLLYRAASFWTRIYAPELSLGMQTHEEVFDATGVTVSEVTLPSPVANPKDLEAALMQETQS